MMHGRTIGLILIAVLFSVAGQLLLKAGARHLAELDRLGFLLSAFRNVHVLAGLAAWSASTLCWLYVLRVAPLSRAYGLTSLTYVLILFASAHLYDEQIRPVHVAGTALIVAGIACLLSGD
jgi:multidrug transporter EmrE-like cation transporter